MNTYPERDVAYSCVSSIGLALKWHNGNSKHYYYTTKPV